MVPVRDGDSLPTDGRDSERDETPAQQEFQSGVERCRGGRLSADAGSVRGDVGRPVQPQTVVVPMADTLPSNYTATLAAAKAAIQSPAYAQCWPPTPSCWGSTGNWASSSLNANASSPFRVVPGSQIGRTVATAPDVVRRIGGLTSNPAPMPGGPHAFRDLSPTSWPGTPRAPRTAAVRVPGSVSTAS